MLTRIFLRRQLLQAALETVRFLTGGPLSFGKDASGELAWAEPGGVGAGSKRL